MHHIALEREREREEGERERQTGRPRERETDREEVISKKCKVEFILNSYCTYHSSSFINIKEHSNTNTHVCIYEHK